MTNPDSKPETAFLSATADGVRLQVYVQPRASRSEIAGMRAGRVKIRIKAAPTDGKANNELRRFLGKTLQIPKSSVHVLKGPTSRQKVLLIRGVTATAVKQHLLQ